MPDGFTKRDFAIFAVALLVAGALTVGVAGFRDLSLRFSGYQRSSHCREIIGNDKAAIRVERPFAKTDDLPWTVLALFPLSAGAVFFGTAQQAG